MTEENNSTEMEQQELMYKFSIFEQQIRELQQQIEAIEKGIIDLNSLNFGLDELVNSEGKEIFASVGKGIFVKAKMSSDELNVDVGNGNFVKKNIPETKELIGEQIRKLEGIRKELEQNLEEIGEEIKNIISQTHKHQKEHNSSKEHNPKHKNKED